MADGDGEKTGIATAVTVTMRRTDERPTMEAEQLSLLPTQVAAELAADQTEGGEAERRGRGRPQGSRNRRTAEWTDHILNNYRSPLLFLAETYTRPVDQLAKELDCDKSKAFDIQVDAATRLAPYVHQKQPVAVNVDGKGIVTLVIQSGSNNDYTPGDDATLVMGGTIVENQGVSGDENGEV